MPLVFITPYKKTYSSEFCSLSTFIGLIFLVLAILIPFFAAFSSEDFWLRLKEYMEQPIVEFDNHYMLYITTFNDSNNPTGTYFYSSNNKLNEIFDNISNNNLNTNSHLENNARITDAKSDEDNDGINDKIIINYETSNNDVIEAKKKDIKLIFFLKYRLIKQVKLIMTPMIYLDIPILDKGAKNIKLNGDIELVQKSPIISTTITSQLYNYENPFYDIDTKLNSPFDFYYYYNKYKNLNYTLKYNYEKNEQVSSDNLGINIEINIPKLQRVFYIQSIFETIKYAWMQYFYIFLPIYIILYLIYKFIIESNIFYSHVKSDL